MTETVLSIVIPAFNEQAELPALFDSLRAVVASGKCEVIVVDNGSTDKTAEIARAFGAHIVAIPRATVAAARNAGVQQAKGRVLAFLDADIVVTPSWIEQALRLAQDISWRDEITGDVCDVGVKPSWLERAWFAPMYRRGANKYLNSGNLLVGRAEFIRVGGFSAELVTGEDVDFCVRALASGIAVRARRDLHVYHNGYPRTLSAFFRREAWHGRGDYSQWRIFVKSRVAQVAVMFAGLHVALAIALVAYCWACALLAGSGIVAICLASSTWKWRQESPHLWLANALVFYFYYLGRAWAAVRQWRERTVH